MTSATRKPSAPAKPDVEIPLAPFFLPVAVELADVAVEVALEQETLDGIVKLFDSVRSAHWVENKNLGGRFCGEDRKTAQRRTW